MLSMLLISMLSSLSALAYDVEIDGIYYNITLKTKQAEVTSGDNKYSGDIVIPSSIIVGNVEYTVTEIGKEAFEKCENLLSVSMPNSIITIRTGAFYGCLNLVSIIIPNSVTTIEGNAFIKCSKIRSVSIPNSVQKIGGYAFGYCKSLSSISIPNSVTEIEGYMFYKCTGLKSITIPQSIKKIGLNVFDGCTELTSVYISDIVSWCDIDFEDVYSTPFIYAKDLYINEELVTDLVLPNSVTIIKQYAFRGCTSLKSIVIPLSVKEIGHGAFLQCTNLTELVIPNSVEKIGGLAFDGCTGLSSISLPNSIQKIGQAAFFGCTALSSVTLPNPLTVIELNLFSACTNLTSVFIPNSVCSIEGGAFYNCKELTDVYCYAEKVPKTNASAFSGSYIEYATLHVPEAAMSEYQATEPWSGFGSFKTLEGTEVEKKQCATPVISYSDGKLQLMCDTPDAECYYTLTVPDAKTNNTFVENNTVTLSACYNITCYAIAKGYEESKKATAKLYWLPSSGILDDTAINVPHRGVAVQSSNGFVYISGLDDDETVSLYSLDGKTLGTVTSSSGYATFPTPRASTVIVRIGSTSIKVTTE